jgi:uncharacterized protein YutE (UPF0331/DUF86 family)
MSTLNKIENKISAVQKYLTIVSRYQKYSRQEIEKNIDVRGMVERYLYLMAQATIDLAQALVAYKGLRKPTTMSDAFYILNEAGIIDNDLTSKMVNMVGFRHIMAHDYEKINYDIVYDVLHQGLKDIEYFLKTIKKFLP